MKCLKCGCNIQKNFAIGSWKCPECSYAWGIWLNVTYIWLDDKQLFPIKIPSEYLLIGNSKEIFDETKDCIRCGYPKATRAPWQVVDGPTRARRWICRGCKLQWSIGSFTGATNYWPNKRRRGMAFVGKNVPEGCLLIMRSKRLE